MQGLHSGLQRVFGFLLSGLPEQGGGSDHTLADTGSLPLSKATIASLRSLAPEFCSRELQDEGLILVSRHDVNILQPQTLASSTQHNDALAAAATQTYIKTLPSLYSESFAQPRRTGKP